MKLIFKMNILGTDTQKDNEVKVTESDIPLSMSHSSLSPLSCPHLLLLSPSISSSHPASISSLFLPSPLYFSFHLCSRTVFTLCISISLVLGTSHVKQTSQQPGKKKAAISHRCLLTNLPGCPLWCHSIPLSKFLQLLNSKTLYKDYSSKVSKNDKLIFEI